MDGIRTPIFQQPESPLPPAGAVVLSEEGIMEPARQDLRLDEVKGLTGPGKGKKKARLDLPGILKNNPILKTARDNIDNAAYGLMSLSSFTSSGSPVDAALNSGISVLMAASAADNIVKGARNTTLPGEAHEKKREQGREQLNSGSRKGAWGVYYGMLAANTLLKTPLTFAPCLWITAGLLGADMGAHRLLNEVKRKGRLSLDVALSGTSLMARGYRLTAIGARWLAGTKWLKGIARHGFEAAAHLVRLAPAIGLIGTGLGTAAAAMDVTLGARKVFNGIQKKNTEETIKGALDIGIGVAMGACCYLSGLPATAAWTFVSIGFGCRQVYTSRKEIKAQISAVKKKLPQIKETIVEKMKSCMPGKKKRMRPEKPVKA